MEHALRDIKPANMFVTRDPNTRFWTTKLLDLGIAHGPAPAARARLRHFSAPEFGPRGGPGARLLSAQVRGVVAPQRYVR